jgi:chemotaxis protein methyltransferase WspC
MNISVVAEVLRQTIGLDTASIFNASIERAVKTRMNICGVVHESDYDTMIATSPEELQELIELVVVSETWFLRDRTPFEFLREHIETEWCIKAGHRQLRILSAPCSTGEEPYSIAAVLCEAGMPAGRYNIEAVDVSRRVIAQASKAYYGPNSFRFRDELFLHKYIQPVKDGWSVVPALRNAVRFRHGNLLELQCMGSERFDIIFCRNMLIYLDVTARKRLINNIDMALVKGGILFLGYAETLSGLADSYERIDYKGAFAFRKGKPAAGDTRIDVGRPQRKRLASTFNTPSTTIPSLSAPNPPSGHSQRREEEISADHKEDTAFATAKALADQGDLTEAAVLCRRYIERNGTDARAHYLLGLICESQGEFDDARRCLENALYLDPAFTDAATQLAMLLERCGLLKQAEACRHRAKRLRTTELTG